MAFQLPQSCRTSEKLPYLRLLFSIAPKAYMSYVNTVNQRLFALARILLTPVAFLWVFSWAYLGSQGLELLLRRFMLLRTTWSSWESIFYFLLWLWNHRREWDYKVSCIDCCAYGNNLFRRLNIHHFLTNAFQWPQIVLGALPHPYVRRKSRTLSWVIREYSHPTADVAVPTGQSQSLYWNDHGSWLLRRAHAHNWHVAAQGMLVRTLLWDACLRLGAFFVECLD